MEPHLACNWHHYGFAWAMERGMSRFPVRLIFFSSFFPLSASIIQLYFWLGVSRHDSRSDARRTWRGGRTREVGPSLFRDRPRIPEYPIPHARLVDRVLGCLWRHRTTACLWDGEWDSSILPQKRTSWACLSAQTLETQSHRMDIFPISDYCLIWRVMLDLNIISLYYNQYPII